MTIDDIVNEILRREGGFVDDPSDKGGATNFGVSLRYMRGIGLDLDGDGDVDRDDVLLVTRERAAQLFKDDFFYGPKIDQLPEYLHAPMFDFAVNSGPAAAVRALQKVCTTLGYPCVPDGRLGPKTRAAVERMYAERSRRRVVNALVEQRVDYYTEIALDDPSQQRFLKGWIARAREFEV